MAWHNLSVARGGDRHHQKVECVYRVNAISGRGRGGGDGGDGDDGSGGSGGS